MSLSANDSTTCHESVGWNYPDNKVHVANMGPTRVLSAPVVSHVGPINLAIRVLIHSLTSMVAPLKFENG